MTTQSEWNEIFKENIKNAKEENTLLRRNIDRCLIIRQPYAAKKYKDLTKDERKIRKDNEKLLNSLYEQSNRNDETIRWQSEELERQDYAQRKENFENFKPSWTFK